MTQGGLQAKNILNQTEFTVDLKEDKFTAVC